MDKNVWSNNVDVEKSSYISEDDLKVYNPDDFELNKNDFVMLDLFSGAGGFSVGCSWAGFQPVLAVDWFEPAIKTWVKNHPKGIAVQGDIRKIPPKFVRQILAEKFIDEIDLLTGGVPCQGFSLANRKHNDNDERNFLFHDYMNYVEEFKPKVIILENVSGMQSTAGGKFVNDILSFMDELGYSAKVKLMNALDFGVPQKRNRLVFVGIKRGIGLNENFNFPEKTTSKGLDLFNLNPEKINTVQDAIGDLPLVENGERVSSYKKDSLSDFQKIMRGEHPKFSMIPKTNILYNHIAPNHPQETIDRIKNTKPGKPMYEKFKQRIRLVLDQPSPTQLAGGIRPQFQFGHPTLARGLTVRERARIQSFPDHYEFLGGTVQERVQTGNAVPPLMIYHLALRIADILKKKV